MFLYNEPLDEAGAHGIQGDASLFVERTDDSFTGIMGLPLCETGLLPKTAGYRFD
jgi:septum formation protein